MSESLNLHHLTTESRNSQTVEIHKANTLGILKMINKEDIKVAAAVQEVLPDIKTAVDCAYDSFQSGGRLIYTGAGTSGRLGVMDAVECPPTYSVSPDQVIGIMAGGSEAFLQAAEGIEDSEKAGAEDLRNIQLTSNDTVIAIAASGRTPYAAGALRYAREVGAHTIALTCNENSVISKDADHSIEVVVGPEAITGSTRMKAATAHKMILNMISTAVMVKIGKVYENLMVDVNVSNKKLKERAISIIQSLTNASYETASKTLEQADHHVKTAIVMLKTSTDQKQAKTLLDEANGFIDKAIENYHP
ncbi:N-acetylmuramic acid 6-phosphate etherase [Bacillus stercoris]|nr:N-acetylmuramic acid 6-phosphate etherase [Bacillus stercoris]